MEVLHLTDEEFNVLGITSIGDRVRLREQCRQILKVDHESPVLSRVRQLQAKIPLRSRVSSQTRRVIFGWKHKKGQNVHVLVQANKGGGRISIDVHKEWTIPELEQCALKQYFPNGKNETANLYVLHVSYYIETFTGEQLDNTKYSVIGDYFKDVKTSPIRLYLYTQLKPDSEDELPDIIGVISSQDERITGGLSQEAIEPAKAQENYSNNNEAIPSCSQQLSSPDQQVNFNPRSYRLSLSRRSEATATTSFSSSHSAVLASRTFVPAIEILDSEDEEIQTAILESVQNQEPSTIRVDSPEQSVAEVLEDFQERYIQNERTNCVVSRTKPLESAIRTLGRSTINLHNKLFVKFAGKIGEDHGGPRREFFRLAIGELQNSKFFEGPDGSKIFTHDLQLVDSGQCRIIGRLLALSLAQDGPGFHCFNKQLFGLMTGSKENATTTEEITDLECLEMLDNITNAQERDQFLAKFVDWLADWGINSYRMTLEEKGSMKEIIIKYHIFYRTSSEISQFVGGMWGMITKHATLFKPLFCHLTKPLMKQDMDRIIRYDFSDIGCNARTLEDDSVYSWELFLQDIEDGAIPTTMSELLSFMTGASSIPPCGFQKPIDIHFYSQEEGVTRLPYVSTCSLDMWLPRGEGPEALSTLILRSLTESKGLLKI